MTAAQRSVSAGQLVPGMAVREVTAFSSEYGALDRTVIAFLQERFAGATCTVVRGGAQHTVPVAGLQPLDELRALTDIPPAAGLERLDEDAIRLLQQRGLRQLTVTDGPAPGPAAAAPGGSPARQARVAEAHTFLERVGQGAAQREEASRLVQDLFNQGRAGKYSTLPADKAVAEIVDQGLSGAMVAIAGLRGSDQTYAHCVDTAVIFQEAYAETLRHQGREVTDDTVRRTLLAGFCHDIGKSTVPREILDSTRRFERDSREMQLMRGHAAAGARILSDLGMDKATVNVAHYHHVKVDGSLPASYPEGAAWDDVLPITRLAAVVDVYQALIGKRSYKKNWVPGKAVDYLRSLRGSEFDAQMLDYFLRVIGLYPVGSLVRLSTGELAFVVAIGGDVTDRPVVAVVENAAGERLTHNPLIDLLEELDIAVTEVVDHYEHYDASEDEAFQRFSNLNVT